MRRFTPAPSPAPLAPATPRRARVAPLMLWAVQGVLAALFLFAGGMKLVLPAAALTAQSPFPAEFLRGVGVLEVLGALGLVLPGLPALRGRLTAVAPLAAGGLLLLMCGAVGATMASPSTAGNPAMALIPAAVGALAAVVAYGRSRPFRRASASAVRPTVNAAPPASERSA